MSSEREKIEYNGFETYDISRDCCSKTIKAVADRLNNDLLLPEDKYEDNTDRNNLLERLDNIINKKCEVIPEDFIGKIEITLGMALPDLFWNFIENFQDCRVKIKTLYYSNTYVYSYKSLTDNVSQGRLPFMEDDVSKLALIVKDGEIVWEYKQIDSGDEYTFKADFEEIIEVLKKYRFHHYWQLFFLPEINDSDSVELRELLDKKIKVQFFEQKIDTSPEKRVIWKTDIRNCSNPRGVIVGHSNGDVEVDLDIGFKTTISRGYYKAVKNDVYEKYLKNPEKLLDVTGEKAEQVILDICATESGRAHCGAEGSEYYLTDEGPKYFALLKHLHLTKAVDITTHLLETLSEVNTGQSYSIQDAIYCTITGFLLLLYYHKLKNGTASLNDVLPAESADPLKKIIDKLEDSNLEEEYIFIDVLKDSFSQIPDEPTLVHFFQDSKWQGITLL